MDDKDHEDDELDLEFLDKMGEEEAMPLSPEELEEQEMLNKFEANYNEEFKHLISIENERELNEELERMYNKSSNKSYFAYKLREWSEYTSSSIPGRLIDEQMMPDTIEKFLTDKGYPRPRPSGGKTKKRRKRGTRRKRRSTRRKSRSKNKKRKSSKK